MKKVRLKSEKNFDLFSMKIKGFFSDIFWILFRKSISEKTKQKLANNKPRYINIVWKPNKEESHIINNIKRKEISNVLIVKVSL